MAGPIRLNVDAVIQVSRLNQLLSRIHHDCAAVKALIDGATLDDDARLTVEMLLESRVPHNWSSIRSLIDRQRHRSAASSAGLGRDSLL